MSLLKNILRRILIWLNIDLTKNLKYDRLTQKIIKRCVSKNSICIDIGSHKGEILDLFLKESPLNRHIALEPIPYLADNLVKKYSHKCDIYSLALSNTRGTSEFNFVINKPAYSGLKERNYDFGEAKLEKIKVNIDRLDNIVKKDKKIDFIKIDVEGGEFLVLKGAVDIIRFSRPTIIFEFGLGASDFYNSTPEDLFKWFTEEMNYSIYTLEGFINNQNGLDKSIFNKLYYDNTEYYFIAASN